MTAPMSAERLAEITRYVYGHVADGTLTGYLSHAAPDLLAEITRLRAEPRLWHSETQGYVRVLALGYLPVKRGVDAVYCEPDWDERADSEALYPTLESLGTFEEPGWEPGVVLPLSAFGGAT